MVSLNRKHCRYSRHKHRKEERGVLLGPSMSLCISFSVVEGLTEVNEYTCTRVLVFTIYLLEQSS